MLLWTDGEAVILATGRGVARDGGDGQQVVRFDGERATRRDEPPPPAFLAVLDPGGRRALLELDGQLIACGLDVGRAHLRELGPAPRAAVALPDGRLVIARAEVGADGRERTTLAVASARDDGGLTIERALQLPAAARARGKFGVWARGAVPWPEDDDEPDADEPFEPDSLDVRRRDGGWQGAVSLHANRHGVVATSTYSGLVVGLAPDTLAPTWSFRLPSQPEAALTAVAVAGGVLATICVGGAEASLLHIGHDGEVRAQRSKLGREPAVGLSRPLLVDGDLALVTNEGEQVYEIIVADLGAKRVTVVPFGGDVGIVAHGSTSDGATHLIALGDPQAPPHKATLHRLVRTAGRLRATAVAMPNLRPPAERRPSMGPPRNAGPASVGIAASGGAWSVAGGAEIDLALTVTSKGGPAPGVWVELSGPALDAALFEPRTAACGEIAADFTRSGSAMRAVLSGAAIDATYLRAPGSGGRVARGESPDPVTTVTIRVRGAIAGSALLMVRIGPVVGSVQAGSQIGSAMQGRTITVT